MKLLKYSRFFCLTCCVVLLACTTYIPKKVESDNILLNDQEIQQDEEVEAMVKPYREKLAESMDEVINHSETEMNIGIPEGKLGNWVADLVYEIGADKYSNLQENDEENIDFALLNNGGLRTALPKGDITRRKIFEIMPFENELVVVTLSYQKTLELFDFIAQKSAQGMPVKKAVPVSKQVNVVIKNGKPQEITLNGQKLPNRNYRIITSDYLLNGGDNMNFFLNPVKAEPLNVKLRDAILEYIISKKQKGVTMNTTEDGRVRYGK